MSTMADLDLFGQEWDDSSWQEKEEIATKAGLGKKSVLKWKDLPEKDQIQLYKASRQLGEAMANAETDAKLKEFYQLAEKIGSLSKELKKLQSQIGSLEEDITAELERTEDNIIETKNFIARIQRKGYAKENPKYKEAFDFLLGKVNPAIRKIAEEALEATKTISNVKAQIAVAKQGQKMMEGVRIWDRVKNMLRKFASKMGLYNSSIEQALGQVNAKLIEVRYVSVSELMKEKQWKQRHNK